MRMPRVRFTVRRMMAAVSIAAVTFAIFKPLEPRQSFVPVPRTSDLVLLIVPTPVGPDGRGRTYTPAEWSVLLASMTSREVLDAALADSRIARLSVFANSTSPHALLARCFGITVDISTAETEAHPAINAVTLRVHCPVAVADVADAVADAIATSGPGGVTVQGRPTGLSYPCRIVPIPWHRDWRVYVVASVSLSAAFLALSAPGRAGSWKSRARPTILNSVLHPSYPSPDTVTPEQ